MVVGINASGRTPYVDAAIREAPRRSALSVSVACNPESAAGREADMAIDVVVGPEFIAGSTRLKAGTAQKLVLNMFTTPAIVRSNKTYGIYRAAHLETHRLRTPRATQTTLPRGA